MKTTVIIPTTPKTYDYCQWAVKSLRDSGIDWDIIVVANGTSVYDAPPMQAKVIYTRDQGQCNAVNIGAKLASPDTDYLFVTNDDMYFGRNWDRNLRFDYPVFSPNLVEPTNNAGSAEPFLKTNGGVTLEEFNQDWVDAFIDNHTTDEKTTNGFNLPFFIRKDVWDTIGGYDTFYDPWSSNSDTDLQTLIEIAGIKPKRLRDVLVYHFSNKSGTFDGTHQDDWWKNFNYYRDKFGYTRDDEPQANTWMCENMVLEDKLVFKPDWKGKYSE